MSAQDEDVRSCDAAAIEGARLLDQMEDRQDLTDEVKAKLDEARRDIQEGRYKTQQPE